MRPVDQSPHICFIDPITLSGLALGALAGGVGGSLMGGGAQSPAPGAPQAPPTQAAAAPPIQQPQGTKPTPKGQQSPSTFIGSAMGASPPVQSGQKSLLGQ